MRLYIKFKDGACRLSSLKEESPITIEVQVQPKSSRDGIVGFQNFKIKVKVTAPPEDGKANERVREIIAEEFGVSKSRVEIVKGQTSRIKTIKIWGVSQEKYDLLVKRLIT